MTTEPQSSASNSRPAPAEERLEWAAKAILTGCWFVGLLAAVRILSAWDDGWLAVVDALYAALVHGIAGLVLAAPVWFMGAWLDDSRRTSPTAAPSFAPPAATPPPDLFEEIRRVLDAGDWGAAEELIQGLQAESDGDPRLVRLVEETSRARAKAGERWRGQVHAAREVNDPARVLDLYEDRPSVFDEISVQDLDRELAKWFLNYVHHRLRTGGLQLDLVTLVDRASSAFGHTRDGASLRAALPTLRRGAGLCARCAKPYTGFSEACPECLGRPEPPPPSIPGLASTEEFDIQASGHESPEGRWFVDPDEEPGSNGRAPG